MEIEEDKRVTGEGTDRGHATAVAADAAHRFGKTPCAAIELVAGLGVRGDAHMGAAVRHRSRVAADPNQPNLRQVHLIHAELHDELCARGFDVAPGTMGENNTTRDIDLLGLPTGAVLKIGENALLAVTGLRNPCCQLDDYQDGLLPPSWTATPMAGSSARPA